VETYLPGSLCSGCQDNTEVPALSTGHDPQRERYTQERREARMSLFCETWVPSASRSLLEMGLSGPPQSSESGHLGKCYPIHCSEFSSNL
jgi:hypothetical protein